MHMNTVNVFTLILSLSHIWWLIIFDKIDRNCQEYSISFQKYQDLWISSGHKDWQRCLTIFGVVLGGVVFSASEKLIFWTDEEIFSDHIRWQNMCLFQNELERKKKCEIKYLTIWKLQVTGKHFGELSESLFHFAWDLKVIFLVEGTRTCRKFFPKN